MNLTNPAHPLPTPRRHLRWPLIVLGLLVGHISLMVVAVIIATHDQANTVLPDYYQKAQHWDQDRAAPHDGGPR
jgi:hypothetical protein